MSLPVIFKYSRIAIFAASSVGSTVEEQHTTDKRDNTEYETDFFQHKNQLRRFRIVSVSPKNSVAVSSSSRSTGFTYILFISAPQQHLGLDVASIEVLCTSISQRQSGFWQQKRVPAVMVTAMQSPYNEAVTVTQYLREWAKAGCLLWIATTERGRAAALFEWAFI
jgi:hypothetical protein